MYAIRLKITRVQFVSIAVPILNQQNWCDVNLCK